MGFSDKNENIEYVQPEVSTVASGQSEFNKHQHQFVLTGYLLYKMKLFFNQIIISVF